MAASAVSEATMNTPYTVRELLDLPTPDWLVENLIPENAFVALYGPSGGGKTFVALDIALSVATGRPWHGRKTRWTDIIYVSAEGNSGISKRVGAWLDAQGIEDSDFDEGVRAHFILSAISVSPESGELVDALENALRAEATRWIHTRYHHAYEEDPPPPLVIIDTLARCFIGDENQQEDMNAFVRALDRLREDYGATIIVVHHTGKDSESERGSSVFRGACDTMLKVEGKHRRVVVSCDKQKDAEPFEPVSLIQQPSEKWESLVLVDADAEPDEKAAARIKAYRAKHPSAAYDDIAKAVGVHKSYVGKVLKKAVD